MALASGPALALALDLKVLKALSLALVLKVLKALSLALALVLKVLKALSLALAQGTAYFLASPSNGGKIIKLIVVIIAN